MASGRRQSFNFVEFKGLDVQAGDESDGTWIVVDYFGKK